MTSAQAAEPPFTIRLDESGIIRQVWARGGAVTELSARAAMEATNELCGALRRPLLADMATTVSIDRRARAVWGEPSRCSRIAVLGSSPVDRLITNVVQAFVKTFYPVKFFTDEGAALVWLKAGLDDG